MAAIAPVQPAASRRGTVAGGETTTTGDAGSVVGAQWETEGRRVNFAASSGGDGQDVSVTLSHTTLS